MSSCELPGSYIKVTALKYQQALKDCLAETTREYKAAVQEYQPLFAAAFRRREEKRYKSFWRMIFTKDELRTPERLAAEEIENRTLNWYYQSDVSEIIGIMNSHCAPNFKILNDRIEDCKRELRMVDKLSMSTEVFLTDKMMRRWKVST